MIDSLPFWVEALASVLLVVGGFFALVGTLGLVRLRDFVMRLHGPTKVSTLGIGMLLIASMLLVIFGEGRFGIHELLITLFLFLTAPISAHLLVRAALKIDPSLRSGAGTGNGGRTVGGTEGGTEGGPAGGAVGAATDSAEGQDGGDAANPRR
jgi:multicomponent K+:H+ antiporter subunit G